MKEPFTEMLPIIWDNRKERISFNIPQKIKKGNENQDEGA